MGLDCTRFLALDMWRALPFLAVGGAGTAIPEGCLIGGRDGGAGEDRERQDLISVC